MHSHDVREFNELKDKTIMLIGGGFSGEDLALQCHKYGSKRIIWSFRGLKMQYDKNAMPSNI